MPQQVNHYHDRTVSREFRDAMLGLYPGLSQNKAYFRLMGHLLFGSTRDTHTRRLMIPSPLLAAMEGLAPGKHYSANKLLSAFRAEVLDFPVEDHFWSPIPDLCRCRAVGDFVLPAALEALVKHERRAQKQGTSKDSRVWLESGNRWFSKHTAPIKRENTALADTEAAQPFVNPSTHLLLSYLNHLPTNRFTSMLNHLPEAMRAAESLNDAENQLNLLSGIRDNVQPLYGPAAKTTRVYSANESVLRLHRSLRKIMTQDWMTADLKSAQLAIVAKVWDVPVLTAYLESGRSVWPDLLHHMGLETSEDNKAVMKRLLYAIAFGAEVKKQRSILRDHAPIFAAYKSGKAAHDHLLSFRLIPALLRARQRQFDLIKGNGGADDAFGVFLPLVKDAEYDNRRSVLACVAQSWELKLLLPVVTLAVEQQRERRGFTMTTFLHNGFTLAPHHPEDSSTWKQRLSCLVNSRTEELGIITSLEFS